MNFNILFLNGSLSCCSSSWSTEKNNQFFYQTVRIYLSYLSRKSYKKRRRWETNAGIFLLPSSIFASRTDYTTSPTHRARSDYIPNGQLYKQHNFKFHFCKRPENTEPLRFSTNHKYFLQMFTNFHSFWQEKREITFCQIVPETYCFVCMFHCFTCLSFWQE